MVQANPFYRANQTNAALLSPRPNSRFQRFLLETKYVRHYGRKLVKVYSSQTEDGATIYVRVGTDDDFIVKEIFQDKYYEKYFAPDEGSVVVDVGANSGFFSLRASKLVGNTGRVLAFEPYSKSFMLLQRHLEANNRVNVTAYHLALGSHPGVANLDVYNSPGNNSLVEKLDYYGERSWLRKEGSEQVNVDTLDAVISRLGVVRVDILKIDTEGSELEVLRGSREVLERYHPKIVAETHPVGASWGELEAFLLSFGYVTKVEEYPAADKLLYAW